MDCWWGVGPPNHLKHVTVWTTNLSRESSHWSFTRIFTWIFHTNFHEIFLNTNFTNITNIFKHTDIIFLKHTDLTDLTDFWAFGSLCDYWLVVWLLTRYDFNDKSKKLSVSHAKHRQSEIRVLKNYSWNSWNSCSKKHLVCLKNIREIREIRVQKKSREKFAWKIRVKNPCEDSRESFVVSPGIS